MSKKQERVLLPSLLIITTALITTAFICASKQTAATKNAPIASGTKRMVDANTNRRAILRAQIRPNEDGMLDNRSPHAGASKTAMSSVPLTPQGSGYTSKRTITIYHTQVQNSQSNFPVLISSGSSGFTYLATTANNGNVQNLTTQTSGGANITVPADAIFTSDSSCSSKLSWEWETYDPSSGASNVWVKVPTLSATSDTPIYLCYGNSSVTTWQGYSNGTPWDSSYKGVWHLPNGTSLSTADSTNNPNSSASNSASAAVGRIDGAASYNGSGQYAVINNSTDFDFEFNRPFTVEFWVKNLYDSSRNQVLISKNSVYWSGPGYQLWTWSGGEGLEFDLRDASGNWYTLGAQGVQDNAWHHIAATYDGTSNFTGMSLYVDGNLRCAGWQQQPRGISSTIKNSYYLTFGINAGSVAYDFLNGTLDEVRVSNTSRLADWIKTEFHNQNSPSTFYTISDANSGSGASYHASADFSGTQGYRNWYYLESTGASMTYSASNGWWQGSETYSLLWPGGGHPGNAVDAVRRWQAPTAGTVHITGSASDGDPNCGDGVIVAINKGTPPSLWQQTINNGNTTGFSYDLTTNVAVGDQINFVINKHDANNWCDTTPFDPTITYVNGGNQSPIANAGGPYSGTAGNSVSFNGSGSYDPENGSLTYAWSFGDGGTGSIRSPTHTYTSEGIYPVSLTVIDNGGAQSTSTTSATICMTNSSGLVICNHGFESPAVGSGAGSYVYNPGGLWTFAGASGISGNYSDFTGSNPPAPEGNQVAFLQGGNYSVISQSIPGWQANTNYTVTFSSAQRANCCNDGGQDFQVYLDDGQLGTNFHPNSTSYADYSTPTFTTTAGAHTLKFIGLNLQGGDHSAFIDNVRISSGPNNVLDARLDPMNRTGATDEDPLSRNFNWSLPIVELPGRAGMDLGISLTYNSLATWLKQGSRISFDTDHGDPAPGFRLGFPIIQPSFYNAQAQTYSYLLVTSTGARVELRRVGSSNLYQAVDSSYLLLDTNNATNYTLKSTDGTQMSYVDNGSYYVCTKITDRNGNLITINYDGSLRIASVIDTLGRTINLNYAPNPDRCSGAVTNGDLCSITQDWSGQPHYWAQFTYTDRTILANWQSGLTVNGPQYGSTIHVLTDVTLPDSSRYHFDYSIYGQVKKIYEYATDGHLLNYRSYDLDTDGMPQGDCPRFTQRRDWAENWNRDTSGNPQETVTTFAAPTNANWSMPDNSTIPGTETQITFPDLTYQKILFGNSSGSEAWKNGLPLATGTYDSSNLRQRWTTTKWTQDVLGVPFLSNPRVIETNVGDPAGNRARTTTDYASFTLPDGTSCHYPSDIAEYQVDAATVIRHTQVDYNMTPTYTNKRIIGLVSERRLYEDPGTANLKSRVAYGYDGSGSVLGNDAPVQHDNPSFVDGRANLSTVTRYEVTNQSQSTSVSMFYNTAGSLVRTRELHQTNPDVWIERSIAYADSFSDGLNHNTLAYPTTMIDGDGFSSTAQYNFTFGGITRRQTPLPNVTSNQLGPVQTIDYDSIGRLQRVTSLFNSAYTRYSYGPNYVETFALVDIVNNVAVEAHALQIFDGAGRVIANVRNHPTINGGGFSAQKLVYDKMGRVVQRSNPTDTSLETISPNAPLHPYNWSPSGDDAQSGWIYTLQTYDWKGRPLVTTNPSITSNPNETTNRSASYSGCGCAGGEVATLTDEMGRQQKVYSDVLGRQWRTEILNSNGTVYSTTTKTFNARDQITLITQTDNSSGAHQDTTINYDGYGRLQTKHVPEQQDANGNPTHTTWAYNPDDTLLTITDARGATCTYGYNGRHLVTSATHALSGQSTIALSYGYDAAGNRTSMSDGLGSQSYGYDSLSRMTSETRTLTGAGPYGISYQYNLANELTAITDPNNLTINYGHDSSGRLSAVTGSGASAVSSYATNLQYRAWGAVKHTEYGDGRVLDATYNSRLQVASFQIPGAMSKTYQYWNDDRLLLSSDLIDHRFDRSYHFDQAGRLDAALSGSEARGQGATQDRPYWESFGYDAMGHLTGRSTYQWSSSQLNMSDSYTNNRHDQVGSLWQYDKDGRLLQMPSTAYTYDAAGSANTVTSSTSTVLGQDGDGRQVKSAETVTDPQSGQTTTTTRYYVRSTVLGGEVLAEMGPADNYSRTFVYANGAVLATQESYGSPLVWWEHRDPSDASYRTTANDNRPGDQAELDPVGANMGISDQSYHVGIPDEGSLAPYPSFSSGANLGTTYSWDGIPMPADEFFQMVGTLLHGPLGVVESFARASANDANYQERWVGPPGDRYRKTTAIPIASAWGSSIDWESLPQNSDRRLTTAETSDLRNRIADLLSDPNCRPFINELLAKTGEQNKGNQPFSSDPLKLFDEINSRGGYTYNSTYGHNTVYSNLQYSSAAVWLLPRSSYGPGTWPGREEYIANEMAEAGLHETLHLAGRNGQYSDQAFAAATLDIAAAHGWKLPSEVDRQRILSDRFVASFYWGGILRSKCKPSGERH